MAIFVVNRYQTIRTLVFLLCALIAGSVFALEIGTIQITSAEKEPFAAIIPLMVGDSERETVRASLLENELYPLVGLETDLWIELLQYQQIHDNGMDAILLNSLKPLPEAENVTIPLLFSSTKHKQHQLHLYQLNQDDLQTERLELYGPVTGTDTLDAISLFYGKLFQIDYLIVMYAIFERNPQAFYRNNMNNVRANVMLVVPPRTQLQLIDKQEAYQVVKFQLEQWQQKRDSEKQGMNERELLLSKARLERLALNNDYLRKERNDLQTQLRSLEAQMSQVVAKVLEPEPAAKENITLVKSSTEPKKATAVDTEKPSEDGFSWMLLFFGITALSGVTWYYRKEVMLWLQRKDIG